MKNFLLAFTFLISINTTAQTSNNYLVTLDNEKTVLQGTVRLDAVWVYYTDASGNSEKIKQKNIKMMLTQNRLFLNLPITKNMDRLQEVHAYNDNYILTAYYQSGNNYLYIFDKQYNAIKRKMLLSTLKKQKDIFKHSIMPYFADCKELVLKMTDNIKSKDSLIKNISMFQCGDSKLFEK